MAASWNTDYLFVAIVLILSQIFLRHRTGNCCALLSYCALGRQGILQMLYKNEPQGRQKPQYYSAETKFIRKNYCTPDFN